jgi:MFS family permease
VAALSVSSLATGLTQIAVPLELRQLHASPNEIGVALSMFGLGMFLFEGLWGALADRVGYQLPLVGSQVLYAVATFFLAGAGSVPQIAVAYLFASGMMVAAGPVGRSFLGTTLPPRLRATGLAFIASQWVVAVAIGAGAGGQLIERIPIREVLYAASVLPLVGAVLLLFVFRGYQETRGIWSEDDSPPAAASTNGHSFMRVMVLTAVIVLLFEIGSGGEAALLPLLVTNHLNLSPATAGTVMFLVGLLAGLLLVPGGMASDRWGRRRTMVAGGVLSAAGFAVYAVAGSFWIVIAGAGLRALGSALVWPAVTAWISESAPHRRHALAMGLFGEFENLGVTLGPVSGGLAWSLAGIQAAFVTYALTAILVAVVCAVAVGGRRQSVGIPSVSSRR